MSGAGKKDGGAHSNQARPGLLGALAIAGGLTASAMGGQIASAAPSDISLDALGRITVKGSAISGRDDPGRDQIALNGSTSGRLNPAIRRPLGRSIVDVGCVNGKCAPGKRPNDRFRDRVSPTMPRG